MTVFLSAGQSARKAAKLSPIQAMKGNEFTKLSRRNVKIPKQIHRLFGIGGSIAYKNLKRSKVKYRATVISIVVSVSIFIGMSTFIQMAFHATTYYYKDGGYQLHLILSSEDVDNNYEKAQLVGKKEEVSFVEIRRMIDDVRVAANSLPFNEKYLLDSGGITASMSDIVGMGIISLGEQAYQEYCKEVGVTIKENEGKAILIADYDIDTVSEDGVVKHISGMMYDYQPGDTISGVLRKWESMDTNDYDEKEFTIELSAITDVRPLSLKNYGGMGYLIVSDTWIEANKDYLIPYVSVYLRCVDAYALEEHIIADFDSAGYASYNMVNEEAEYQKIQSLYLLIAIFLYGFITVIAFIGITNIFNTITTNMELRAREFAMLKSIGMTNQEFRRMIRLESLFYGSKSLLLGIPLGCGFSYLFYVALIDNFEMPFQWPVIGILISVVAVTILLFVITRYSMAKINQRNIIEIIQNENI